MAWGTFRDALAKIEAVAQQLCFLKCPTVLTGTLQHCRRLLTSAIACALPNVCSTMTADVAVPPAWQSAVW